jgi:hypothetical protein
VPWEDEFVEEQEVRSTKRKRTEEPEDIHPDTVLEQCL